MKNKNINDMPTNETKESKQLKLDLRYLRMARIWAENSYCQRRKVGALVVKEKMIISDGYNGTPSGFENVCEDATDTTKPYGGALHRVLEAHHTGWHKTRDIRRAVPSERRHRPAATR